MRISDSLVAPVALPAPPPSTMRNSRRLPRPEQEPREHLRCAQCGPDPAAHMASTDGGLMQRKNTEDSCCFQTVRGNWAGLIAACVACGTIRSQRCRQCNLCGSDTLLRELRDGDTFRIDDSPGIRMQRPVVRQPVTASTSRRTSGRLSGTSFSQNETSICSPNFAGPRRWHSLGAWSLVVPQLWAEGLEGAMSGHQSWALLCGCSCRLLHAKIPKGVDRNSELKQRLHLWETGHITGLISKVLGQQNSGPLHRASRRVQPLTDEQRGKRACALTAISKAMKGLEAAPRRALLTAAETGLQLSSHGALALELIPPVRSAPRRRGLPGAVEGTKWHEKKTRPQSSSMTSGSVH